MEPALAIFASLLGNCYSASIMPGVEDTHCFREMYDGAHVRDTHVVTENDVTTYQGETIYSEGPSGIELRYVNSLGGAGNGTARPEGNTIVFDMTMRADPSKPNQPIHSVWRLTGNGYDVESSGRPTVHFVPARSH